MNRRTVLKQLVIIAGGMMVLPACVQEKSKAGILLKNMEVDAASETLLADISETILPATEYAAVQHSFVTSFSFLYSVPLS